MPTEPKEPIEEAERLHQFIAEANKAYDLNWPTDINAGLVGRIWNIPVQVKVGDAPVLYSAAGTFDLFSSQALVKFTVEVKTNDPDL